MEQGNPIPGFIVGEGCFFFVHHHEAFREEQRGDSEGIRKGSALPLWAGFNSPILSKIKVFSQK